MNFIVERFQEGGFFMFPILGLLIFTLAVIAERTYTLYFKLKVPPVDFRKQLLQFIVNRDFESARDFIESYKDETALGKIALQGCNLRARGCGEEELQARMDESLATEVSSVDKRTGFLAMFGNVATLAGLLGTIVGMVHSFGSVAQANPVDRATMLSQGISEALNCTAFGLIVAIPALVCFAIFQNKTDGYITDLTERTSEIFHDLLFYGSNEKSVGDTPSVVSSSASTGRKPELMPGA